MLKTPPLDAFEQMALDELLLESQQPAFVLRFYEWNGPAVTFGYFQRYGEVAAVSEGLPAVRRPTGGGVVFHHRDVTFSFIFPDHGLLSPPTVYETIHRSIQMGFKSLGIATSLWSLSPGIPKTSFHCFLEPSPLDLVLENGKKALGGSLRRRRGRILYQGCLDLPRIEKRRLRLGICQGLSGSWNLAWEHRRAGRELMERIHLLTDSKYRTPEWNRKR